MSQIDGPNRASAALKVLVVEDDLTIASNLVDYLSLRGHSVDVAYDGQAAVQRLGRETQDVILLDLGLPRADGFDVLSAARQRLMLATPILVLTARDALESRLQAFALGADDFVSKPFSLAEVAARVEALHRRATGAVVATLSRAGALTFDRRTRVAAVDGRRVHLMPMSALILERLMRDPGELVRRQELERLLWPDDDAPPEALRGQVYLLRKALSDAGFNALETVHGVGFRLPG